MTSSDGRTVLYNYFHTDKDIYLSSVSSSHGVAINYEYEQKYKDHWMMTKKSLPDDRYTKIQYYRKGANKLGSIGTLTCEHKEPTIGRVAALFAPVGADASPIRTWTFIYDLDKLRDTGKPIGGRTIVYDAYKHKTIYSFSKEHRLTEIAYFCKNGGLYRREIMDWETEGAEKTFLQTRGITDPKYNLLIRRDYFYDDAGNVLANVVRGNLTGSLNTPVTWSRYWEAEYHDVRYTYTSGGLVATEDDGRKKTFYQYVLGTNLLALKLVSDKSGICERFGYKYNKDGILIQEIVDDGNSRDIDKLTKVTERRIKNITLTESQPRGLPAVIQEAYVDLVSGQQKRLRETHYRYSKEGHLLQEDVYDNVKKLCYTKKWRYDERGNVIKEIDPLGHQIT